MEFSVLFTILFNSLVIIRNSVWCRVQAGSDCGFATFGALPTVHPEIAWAKLASLAEGARLAAAELAG